MSYIVIYLFLYPIQKLLSFFKVKTGKNLIIQTSKIGDFINITPMLNALGHTDLLISQVIEPLVRYDDKVSYYYCIEKIKSSFFNKILQIFNAMNRYDNVYLVQPNTFNLLFASLCNAPNKQFLKTYAHKFYYDIFYRTATGIVKHEKHNLTIDSYLKLINRDFCYKNFIKHATSPLHLPNSFPEVINNPVKGIKVGISIAAGNNIKIIPTLIWANFLFLVNEDIQCTFFVFGVSTEQYLFDKLSQITKNKIKLINLIGQINLEDLPWAISQMNLYVSSDSGNAYIADSFRIPIIIFYGPCEIKEQRPIHNVLFIGQENIPASSFVFSTQYSLDVSSDILFSLDAYKILKIKNFIRNNYNKK